MDKILRYIRTFDAISEVNCVSLERKWRFKPYHFQRFVSFQIQKKTRYIQTFLIISEINCFTCSSVLWNIEFFQRRIFDVLAYFYSFWHIMINQFYWSKSWFSMELRGYSDESLNFTMFRHFIVCWSLIKFLKNNGSLVESKSVFAFLKWNKTQYQLERCWNFGQNSLMLNELFVIININLVMCKGVFRFKKQRIVDENVGLWIVSICAFVPETNGTIFFIIKKRRRIYMSIKWCFRLRCSEFIGNTMYLKDLRLLNLE